MLVALHLDSSQEEIVRVFDASNEIFEKDDSVVPVEAPFDLSEWVSRLQASGEIVYSQNDVSGEVEAFVFAYQRAADKSQLHVWIAGCKENFRRNKIMFRLFDMVETNAAKNGYKSLTVNTYPERFVNMPAFLASREFELVSTTPGSPDTPGDIGVKLAYRKLLSC